jgi:hypothetical protein
MKDKFEEDIEKWKYDTKNGLTGSSATPISAVANKLIKPS